ncbi:PREDICTED: alpha-amylase [Prunus dulcis]|uniref:PREDICTED: alpha-amylase n=1 Tax=Prunus dulcis TaxID=3755 RepID=A0A5E4FXD1_PRUDU|nr:PREDICTED: alpha-amylase [Prunus dulcis]
MEAFVRSSTTLFPKANIINKPLPPLKSLLGRSDICFLRSLNSNVHVHLLRHKALQLVAPSQTEVVLMSETAGIGIQTTETSETVHVQFQLHKECNFGESFLLVGNEPIMGEWNPASAIPLNWSDGNIWTVELDMPVGIAVQYKFILKKITGDLSWQPGPDRILHTWNTKNNIAIAEDWKDSELQKISEMQITNQNEALLVNPGLGPIVPGNVTLPGEESKLNVNKGAKVSDKIASADDKPTFNSNNEFVLEEKAIKSADGTLLGIRKEVRVSDDGKYVMKEESIGKITPSTVTSKIPGSVEDEETLPTYEGGNILVPSLTPIQGVPYEETVPKELGKPISSKETLPKELENSMASKKALRKELGISMSAQEALPKELGISKSSEESLPNELGRYMSSEEPLPKELGRSMSFEEALPEELGISISSEEALPNELGKSMTSKEALPKEVGRSMSSEAVLPKELGKSITSDGYNSD